MKLLLRHWPMLLRLLLPRLPAMHQLLLRLLL
jgi:hypothetical protein